MTVSLMEERPPFIECFIDAVEDRDESIKQGRYIGKDVIFFKVTPAGGKLEVITQAEDKLRTLRKAQDRFLPFYEAAYKAFKEGQEPPTFGTPINQAPFLSVAQVKLCQSVNVRSIEDLATLNEEGLSRLGMGARGLQQKAMSYLQAAEGPGKIAERMAALEARLNDQDAESKRLAEENAALRAKLAATEGPRESVRGRQKAV